MPKVITKKSKFKIVCGDAEQELKLLASESIDLVVTSPPYDGLRTYNGFSFNFQLIALELFRVMKVGGVIVWVVADQTKSGSESLTSLKQAIYFKEVCGANVHDTMIWTKTNAHPLTHNRYEQKWEYMFVFSKGKPKTFNPLTRKTKNPGKVAGGTFLQKSSDSQFSSRHSAKPIPEEVRRWNVWEYSVGHQKNGHPAVFPYDLARDHILSWSNPEDVVLDPFLGSGTTLRAAIDLNRIAIGFDVSKAYCNLAESNLCRRS